MTTADNASGDRRYDAELRELFTEAYEVLEPFFNRENQWGGRSHEHLAYRALHERFPKLSGDQIFTLVDAGKRVFASGGKPAE